MRILTRIALGLLLFVLTSACSGCEAVAAQFRSPAERYRLEGERLLGEERTAEAIMAFRAAVDSDAANLAALKRLAPLYANQGRLRLALRLLARARTQFPQDGDVANQVGQYTQALADGAAGNLLWKVDLGDSEPVGFGAAASRIYLSLNDGGVLAVDPISETVLWRVKLPAQATSAPVAADSQLWLGAQDGQLYALAAADGSVLWKFATKAPIYASPAFNETTVYLPSGDGTFYALERASGALRWSFTSGAALHAQPTLAGGMVVFGSNDGRLYALDAVSGQPKWADGIQTQGAVESQALIADDRVYVGSGDSRLYALAAASGGEYWRFSTPDAIYATPLLSENFVIVASAGGTLTALQKTTGQAVWNIKTGAALSYPPVSHKQQLYYVVSGRPTLYAVVAQTGAATRSFNSGDWFSAGPLILNNTLYLLSKAGYLLAYPLE